MAINLPEDMLTQSGQRVNSVVTNIPTYVWIYQQDMTPSYYQLNHWKQDAPIKNYGYMSIECEICQLIKSYYQVRKLHLFS